MITTNTFSKNIKAFVDPNKRLIIDQGGTSSGKTYSTLQMLILYAVKNKKKELISIVSESVPHLKRGALRDFIGILENEGLYKESAYNRTNLLYVLNNKTFEFFSADSADKLRGGRRDILFINECNNVSYEAYTQLAIRTRKKIILDYNPSHEFWVYTQGLYDRARMDNSNAVFIKSTYRDNNQLDQAIIDEIESRRITNPNWYKVYGLGELGSLEGAVYPRWSIVDEFPDTLSKKAGFIDFGFTNDPCAVGIAGLMNQDLYAKEIIYESGLTNTRLAEKIKALGYQDIRFIADNAEPKSIAELRNNGINVSPCVKGAGSIEYGIGLVNDRKMYIERASLNAIKELRNYRYKYDEKIGKFINTPVDDFNHFLDGVRYYAMEYLKKNTGIQSIPICYG